jgi:hypothetical protein
VLPIRYHFGADPNPAFNFYSDPDSDPAFYSDADPDPASQNDDPDLQHCTSATVSGFADLSICNHLVGWSSASSVRIFLSNLLAALLLVHLPVSRLAIGRLVLCTPSSTFCMRNWFSHLLAALPLVHLPVSCLAIGWLVLCTPPPPPHPV